MPQYGMHIEGETLIGYRGSEKTVVVPDYIRIIGQFAFAGNTEIREVILSQNIEIQDAAFKGCYNLETLTEQNETLCISELGENAFSGCENLRTCLFVEDAMIKEKTFYGCKELRVVELLNMTDIE